jgi:peptide methionine sulfoxide reductase MsrB
MRPSTNACEDVRAFTRMSAHCSHTLASLLRCSEAIQHRERSRRCLRRCRAGGEPRRTSVLGYDVTPMTQQERDAAAAGLSAESRRVCLSAGTERPVSGTTSNGYRHDNKNDGVYACALGGLPLFDSKSKFDSGTSWPSFYAPIDKEHVLEVKDSSIPFMTRRGALRAVGGAPRPRFQRRCAHPPDACFVGARSLLAC